MNYRIMLVISYLLSFSLLHSMEKWEDNKREDNIRVSVPSIRIVAKSGDMQTMEEEDFGSPSDQKNEELSDSQIAEMLYNRFEQQFPNDPEIVSRVNKIAADFCVNHDDVKQVLRRTRGSPRYDEKEYKKKMAELELEVLRQEIINAQEKNKLAQDRLVQEKHATRETLRLGYCNLILGGAIGFITVGISAATLITLLANGSSE